MKSRFVVMFMLVGAVALSAARAVAEERPAELVRQEVAAVLALLDDKSLDSETRRQMLSDRLARHFDFEDMSRSILAVNWKDATDLQRERFKALFRKILEQKYVSAIEKRTSETIRVGGERIRGDRASVIVTIERGKANDIPLLFKLKRTTGGWRAYDANVEGLSLVQHYRDELAAIAKNRGIDGVLRHLEAQVAL
jgi:phospholipid transport system substrate-binding protein